MTATAFADFLIEQLAPLGRIVCRPMFGATGLFLNGLMFAIVTRDDAVYVKAGDAERRFEAAGFDRFGYLVKGQPRTLGYHRLTDEVVADQAQLLHWVRLGFRSASWKGTRRKGDLPAADDPVLGMLLKKR